MKIREYSIQTTKPNIDLKLCLVSDLHSRRYDRCLSVVKSVSPDAILLGGDILERLDGLRDKENKVGFEFLSYVKDIAPTFYAFGNHERFGSHREHFVRESGAPEVTKDNFEKINSIGINIINDSFSMYKCRDSVIYIGGLMPANDNPPENPNLEFLKEFSSVEGFKLLISHQPEYFDEYLAPYDIDLIVSGHTHGGQWKFFGRGVFAPNQGLLPKYSSGLYNDKLIVCAGASNTVKLAPRFFNPCEIVVIKIKST